jgi:hypothetical protein
MQWILEKNVYPDTQFKIMQDTALDLGHIVHHIRIVPFEHVLAGTIRPNTHGQPVVCYGSIGIAKVAKQYNWAPGVFRGDFSTTAYKALGSDFLNYDARVYPLSKVVESANSMESGQFFCKPNDDNKAFAGQVFDVRNFDAWVQRMREIGYLDDNDFDVVTSSVKPLAIEYRVLVVDKQVIDMCIYRQWKSVMPERVWDHDVAEFVEGAVWKYSPADVFIIDVAQTLEGLKVVEYNTFNSAGLYAIDPAIAVTEISDFVENKYVSS